MTKVTKTNNIQRNRHGHTYYDDIFPTILRDVLEKSNTTQKELADKIEVTRQTISLYVNGDTTPDIMTFNKIITFFKEKRV